MKNITITQGTTLMKKKKVDAKSLVYFKNNRSETSDRPVAGKDCRDNPSSICEKNGHDFVFNRMDRYGNCKRCGTEILT